MSGLTSRLSLFSILLAAACTAAPEATTQDDATAAKASEPTPIAQQQIDDAMTAFTTAMRNGDGSVGTSTYAADATFVSARGKVETEPAITTFWTEAIKGGAGKSLELHPLKFGSSGDLAWALHHYVGGITAPTGHVLTVFQRQADGSVKVVSQVSIPEAAAK